jgi:hypothetical protein
MLSGRNPRESSCLMSSLQTAEYISTQSAMKSSALVRFEKRLWHALSSLQLPAQFQHLHYKS